METPCGVGWGGVGGVGGVGGCGECGGVGGWAGWDSVWVWDPWWLPKERTYKIGRYTNISTFKTEVQRRWDISIAKSAWECTRVLSQRFVNKCHQGNGQLNTVMLF